MKITTKEDWQFSVDVFQTENGPVARFTDARQSLLVGDDAGDKFRAMAKTLREAAEAAEREVAPVTKR